MLGGLRRSLASSTMTRFWRLLNESLPGRVVGGLGRVASQARTGSRVWEGWQRVAAAWASWSRPAQLRAIGVMGATAVATHLLMVWPARPAGGWWLIVPAIAAAFSAAASAASGGE